MKWIRKKINGAWTWVKTNVKKTLIATGIVGVALAATVLPIKQIDIYNASLYKNGTIILVKPIATGVGNGRYEAGDIVAIRDGSEEYAKWGTGDFLGKEEKKRFITFYYPGKISEAQKTILLTHDIDTTDPLNPVMLKRRKMGIDYSTVLTASDILIARSNISINKVPTIDLNSVKTKARAVKSVVKIPTYIALAESVKNKMVDMTPIAYALATSTKTVDTGGYADYLSLSAWEAGEQANLVTSDQIAFAELHYDTATSSADTTAVTINGWTTDATRYIKIATTAGARHDGKWNTAKYRLEVANTPALIVNDDNVRIDGLQVTTSGTTDNVSEIAYYFISSTSDNYLKNTIIKGNGTYSNGLSVASSSAGNLKAINNIIYGAQRSFFGGVRYLGSGTTLYIYNNTLVDNEFGIAASSGTVVAKNNIAKGNINKNYDGSFDTSSDYNSSSNGTSTGGANDKINQTFTFVDSANKDYHLASGDTGAKDSGTDLSADATLPFSTDIDGETRSGTWDIGADEYISAVTNPDGGLPTFFQKGTSFIKGIMYVK